MLRQLLRPLFSLTQQSRCLFQATVSGCVLLIVAHHLFFRDFTLHAINLDVVGLRSCLNRLFIKLLLDLRIGIGRFFHQLHSGFGFHTTQVVQLDCFHCKLTGRLRCFLIAFYCRYVLIEDGIDFAGY